MNNTVKVTYNSTDSLCSVAINTPVSTITKVSIYSVIAIVSLLGNFLLVLIFFRTKSMKKTIDVFVINMAMSDLFIPVCLIPRLIVSEITGSEAFLVQGVLGSILCKISNFLTDVSLSVSTHSLVMITVERFLAVVFPFTVRQISSKLRFNAILIVWIIAMGIHAPYFYTFRLTESGDCKTNWEPAFDHELTHSRYYTALFVVVVILPFTLITILYSIILWTLFYKTDKLSLHRSYRQREKNKKKEELRVLRMAVTIVIAFAVCWAPFNVQQLIILFAPEKIPKCSLVYSVYSEAALVLAVAYCTVNPVICFIFVRNYRIRERLASLRSKLNLSSRSCQKETE
ncbi:neuropeptide FF receptor 2-like [Oculina patagonica]